MTIQTMFTGPLTATIVTTTGGTYQIAAHRDGRVVIDGHGSNGRPLHAEGSLAGTAIHPDMPHAGPMFYLGEADPVCIGDEFVTDHDRRFRSGPIAAVIANGQVLTPDEFHGMTSIDAEGVPMGHGFHSDEAFAPVVTHELPTDYCPTCDTFGDLFACQP